MPRSMGPVASPYELEGRPIVPPDAVPTPNGLHQYGDCHEQLFPNVYQSPEGMVLAGCFKYRRHSTVSSVDALFNYVNSRGSRLSLYMQDRLRKGGNAWFAVSPHVGFRPTRPEAGIRWTPLEPNSPAMREALEWLTLYLCLGWEIPAWGPVPGVWFPEHEWVEIVSHAKDLIRAGNLEWVQFPHGVRRIIREQRPDSYAVPVLKSRLPLVKELMLRDWELLEPACSLTQGVRQFSFRNDMALHQAAYQLVPSAFRDAIARRRGTRRTQGQPFSPASSTRPLPTRAARRCRQHTRSPMPAHHGPRLAKDARAFPPAREELHEPLRHISSRLDLPSRWPLCNVALGQ